MHHPVPTMTSIRVLSILSASIFLSSCATVGYEFPAERVKYLEIGLTNQSDVKKWFGESWRKGSENGLRTWTYGHYHYSLFAPAQTQDLLLRFDDQGILRSYSYNSTESPNP